MAVRNFWISAHIDGRTVGLAGGPKSKTGGFRLYLYQRDKGQVRHIGIIIAEATADGELTMVFQDHATPVQIMLAQTKRD